MADLLQLLGGQFMPGVPGRGLGGPMPGAGDASKDDLGGGMLSARDANTIALVDALRQQQQAGLQRTASPIGSIANAIAPLLEAPIRSRMMQQQAAMEMLPMLVEMAKLRGQPDKEAAELAKIQAETGKITAETSASKTKSEREQKLYEMLGLGGGGEGKTPASVQGMKPKITMGPNGPTVTYSSDVMSPERLSQEQSLAGIRAGETLQREKEFEEFKRTLPPKMSDRDRDTVASGKTLLGLLGDAESVIKSIPKDVSPEDLANSALNYQMRSEHPERINMLKAHPVIGGVFGAATGITGESNPKLDPYFSWIGQVQSALASFNVQGQRGGIKLLQYLKDHFPNYADSPQDALRKTQLLRKDSAVIERRIQSLMGEMQNAGQAASDAPGGEMNGGWVGRPVYDKKGTEKRLWVNPSTGAKMILDPGQAPPLE